MNDLIRVYCGECNDHIQYFNCKRGRNYRSFEYFKCDHVYVRTVPSLDYYFDLTVSKEASIMRYYGKSILLRNGNYNRYLNNFDYISFAAKSLKQRQEWLDKIILLG